MAPTKGMFQQIWLFAAIISLLTCVAQAAMSTKATVLLIVRDEAGVNNTFTVLQGYGIPYRILEIPIGGSALPALNSTPTTGNYGSIVVHNQLSYNYAPNSAAGEWRSALTQDQWNQIYAYQKAFKVRLVHLDVYPSPAFGVEQAIPGQGCCGAGESQVMSLVNMTGIETSNLKRGAGLTTDGLFHHPAKIVNPEWSWEFAQFSAGGAFKTPTTAAVINRVDDREQMAFFIGWASDWAPTTNFFTHAYVHWMTRGLYVGFRRLYFNTQIDDMFLVTDLYQPQGSTFRIRPGDLEKHITWQKDINRRMPAGSNYMVEVGHNGNGDIEAAVALATQGQCNPLEAIEYPDQVDTVLEYVKIPGTGTDVWPASPLTYRWSLQCANLDPLAQWFKRPEKRDAFMHVSHTFTHEALNNATYADASKEISFNRAWMQQQTISQARFFSPNGLIPPAITGLHNGDAVKAWSDNGIKHVVGDNTREQLRNQKNYFWPLITTVASNGHAGVNIIPRWATTIYYNCDLPDCTLQEWINTSGGQGNFEGLLENARITQALHLLQLHWDPYMFHQANLRAMDVPPTLINGRMQQLSLLMIWTEVVVAEMTRLTDWPLITKKHDDIGQAFLDRMARDQCSPSMTLNYSDDGRFINSVTIGAFFGNKCVVPIPVTVPKDIRSLPTGATREKIGKDALTVWVKLQGQPVTVPLNPPMPL